jgi:predicted nucleotidyltransferase
MAKFPFDTQKVIDICSQNDIAMMGVFGSSARGESTLHSDIDLLVRFIHPKSLLFIVQLERKLSEITGKKVELLTEEAISPYLRDRINKELKIIYETR